MTKRSLHVCILIDAWEPFVGGAQVHLKALQKYLPLHHIKTSLFHSPHPHIFIRSLWLFWVIPQIILAHFYQPFDLIHAHAFAAGLPAKIISLILGIPVVYTVHGSHLMDTKTKGIKAKLERWLLTGIKYTQQISVTQSFLKYPNVNKNISVIRNGVDIKAFDKVKIKKSKNFTLLYVGRDHPTKGLDILRLAFAQVNRQYPQIKLKLVTGGLSGQQLIKAYKRAHAFVLPSLVEGQPLVLLEAWAAKLPVIATKTAGVAEIATSRNTVLVNPGSSNQLAQAIIKLYTMPSHKRQALAQAGYQSVQGFTWATVAAQTASVYFEETSFAYEKVYSSYRP